MFVLNVAPVISPKTGRPILDWFFGLLGWAVPGGKVKVGSPLLITGLWPHMLPLAMVYGQVNASSLNSDTSKILEAPVHERLAQAGPASPLGLGLLQVQILLPKLR